jgi:L-lactate dehydrogenase complex protein LldE
MTVGLFIPCYVDKFYPQAAIACIRLMEKLGCSIKYPKNQTCCGQPMSNSGFGYLTSGCNELFIRNFSGFDYIVCPSGSCTLHLKEHLYSKENGKGAADIRGRIFEFTEFMVDILKVESLDAKFPYKVGLHQSCHGQRGLKLSAMSELVAEPFSKPVKLLKMVDGIDIIALSREDECCGFGGTFCISEEAISVKMGKDRVKDHLLHGADFITSPDMSCLMHMEGILKRQKSRVQVKHIAEILNSC